MQRASPMPFLQNQIRHHLSDGITSKQGIKDLKCLSSITYLMNVVKEQIRCISVSCSRSKATTERREDGQLKERQRAASEVHTNKIRKDDGTVTHI